MLNSFFVEMHMTVPKFLLVSRKIKEVSVVNQQVKQISLLFFTSLCHS